MNLHSKITRALRNFLVGTSAVSEILMSATGLGCEMWGQIALHSLTLREKCPYFEFFWSVFSPDAGNYGPEKLQIRTLHAVSNYRYHGCSEQ